MKKCSLGNGHIDLVQELSAFFADRQEVVAAYLFGSQARGQAGPLSDVDIAVLVKDEEPLLAQSLEYRLSLWNGLAALLNRDDIDVVLLNEAPLLLRHRVLRDGVLLDCKDDQLRVSFAACTLRDYLDTAFLRRLDRIYMEKRIQSGQFGRPVEYKRLYHVDDTTNPTQNRG